MKGIIYKATNKINGKIYMGKTIKLLSERKSGHKHNAFTRNYKGYFYNAIRKYGFDNFKFEIIDYALTEEILFKMEKYYIKKLKTKFPNGYNITDGGEGTSGYKHTKKIKTGRYKKCLVCSKKFWIQPSNENRGKGKYCSLECMGINKQKDRYKKCLVCGKEFRVYPYQEKRKGHGKYCSNKCAGIAKRGKVNLKRRTGKYKRCLICGKEFWVYLYKEKKGEGKYCSKKCYFLGRSKNDNV